MECHQTSQIVPEDQIGRARPSILFPKSTSLATLTQSLSSLLVLVQDEKIDNSIQTESASERHARRKAVEQFIHQQLDDIEPVGGCGRFLGDRTEGFSYVQS